MSRWRCLGVLSLAILFGLYSFYGTIETIKQEVVPTQEAVAKALRERVFSSAWIQNIYS